MLIIDILKTDKRYLACILLSAVYITFRVCLKVEIHKMYEIHCLKKEIH